MAAAAAAALPPALFQINMTTAILSIVQPESPFVFRRCHGQQENGILSAASCISQFATEERGIFVNILLFFFQTPQCDAWVWYGKEEQIFFLE